MHERLIKNIKLPLDYILIEAYNILNNTKGETPTMLKRTLLAALLVFVLAGTVNAKASQYKKITEPLTEKKMEDLRKFFELSGSVTAAINFADFMSSP